MYLRWAENHNFLVRIEEENPGEVLGIRKVTMHISGENAYGWLAGESGIHRLVRYDFNSSGKRQTSFASVTAYRELPAEKKIDLKSDDLRIETFRASGAGGQHVNRTDSAVRITHLPTKISVQCQAERSQHRNKAFAMKQLQARLHAIEEEKRQADRNRQEKEKPTITWGNQIRSYVLDQSYVKDLVTGFTTHNPQKALDGEIQEFLLEKLLHRSSKVAEKRGPEN